MRKRGEGGGGSRKKDWGWDEEGKKGEGREGNECGRGEKEEEEAGRRRTNMEEEGRRRNVFGVSRNPSDSFYTMHATVGCDQPVACNMAWWFALMAVAAGTENTIQRRLGCFLSYSLFE